jgi:hypothetical protein
MFLESGQGKSEGTDKGKDDSCRLLYRHILCQAVHDLGYGGKEEREGVREFLQTDWFETICDFSAWDQGWVRKIAAAVDEVDDDVRNEITKQVVQMMKGYARVPKDDRPHNTYRTQVVSTRASGR